MDNQNSQFVGDTTKRFASLCKEYTNTLDSMRNETTKIVDACIVADKTDSMSELETELLNIRLESLLNRSTSLSNPLQNLARTISQQIEHSELPFNEKAELQVRLGVLESSIFDTQFFIQRVSAELKKRKWKK